jgi:hypothetical protein
MANQGCHQAGSHQGAEGYGDQAKNMDDSKNDTHENA